MRPPSLASLSRRVLTLENEFKKTRDAVITVEDFIEFTFDKARWDILTPTAPYDQSARKEQLGFLHAVVTIWEKLGHETPEDIGRMIHALAGHEIVEKPSETIPAGK